MYNYEKDINVRIKSDCFDTTSLSVGPSLGQRTQ